MDGLRQCTLPYVHCLGSQDTSSSDHNGAQINDFLVINLSPMITEPFAPINVVCFSKKELF